MEQKQAAIFNDLSGFGRCSISVILPILSAMGHQGVAIPTAVLSMHTEFPHYHMIDLSDQLPAYLESYRKEGLRFDALCTGFLSNPTQAQIARSCLQLLKEDALVLIDPVLGDGGRPYPTITKEIITQMRSLASEAGVLLPNLTELCLLCGRPYPDAFPSRDFLLSCCEELCAAGTRTVVVSGLELDGRCCSFIYAEGKADEVWNEKVGEGRPGSGDVFAAVIAGSLLRHETLHQSVERAARFVEAAMRKTLQEQAPHAWGLCFEGLLSELMPTAR